MNFLNTIRSAFMKNPFTVGFNNKSPLNVYKSSMPTSFNLPTLGTSYTSPKIEDNKVMLDSANKTARSILEAGIDVAKAAGENVARKREKEQTALDEEKKKQDSLNKVKKGSFAQKLLDPDAYTTYTNAMESLTEERKAEKEIADREKILKKEGVPDVSKLTGTSDDY